MWLAMACLPRCDNMEEDKESHTFRRYNEWCQSKTLKFATACNKLRVTPNINVFASWINCQITSYVSYRADPKAFAVNVFHITWMSEIANSPLVAKVNADVDPAINTTLNRQRNSVRSQQPTGTPSIAQETVPDSMPLVPGYLEGNFY